MTGGMRRTLAAAARRQGLELIGVTTAAPAVDDRRRMEGAVAAGRMARMGWMGGDRAAVATDPARNDPSARSVIVVAAPYAGSERAGWDPDPDALRRALDPVFSAAAGHDEPLGQVARYANGGDYHRGLRSRLEALAADLREHGLPAGSTAFVDDRPLAERAFAARAGIGWIGKNTNLLTHQRSGSWVLIGALLSSVDIEPDEPLRTTCGGCTRCIAGCPTGAIVGPRTIDAGRCISYLTIEHPGAFRAEEARAIGSWIFGCDVCQEVCPVNAEADDPGALRVPLLSLVEWLGPIGTRAFTRALGGTALTRAGRHRLLRNALAAIANAARPDAQWAARAEVLVRGVIADRRVEVATEARRTLAALTAARP